MADLREIKIRTKPYKDMRYPTVGDWQEKRGVIQITVAKELGLVSGLAMALHEIVEKVKCDMTGVTEQQVDEWDMSHLLTDDPGLDPDAPYHEQHLSGEAMERAACVIFNLPWKKHCKIVDEAEKAK